MKTHRAGLEGAHSADLPQRRLGVLAHPDPKRVEPPNPQVVLAADRLDLRARGLLSKMTLEEKIGQMTQPAYVDALETQEQGRARMVRIESMIREGRVGSLLNVSDRETADRLQKIAIEESRLGVPLLFAHDVLHGFETIFPVPLAMAATFDPSLVERAAEIAGLEARASGVHWTYAPMADVSRDPRWGRVVEGWGEDPVLGSAMTAASVRGFGRNVASCLKHFAAYGAPEAGRDYASADLSPAVLEDWILPPFRAGLRAGASTVMTGFHALNGVPMTANRALIDRVLDKESSFDGVIVSDFNAVAELIPHGVASSESEAARKAVLAGVRVDMESGVYERNLAREVKAGRVPMSRIDQAARRMIELKLKLGLFDAPYTDRSKVDPSIRPEHRRVALEVAKKSIVLLKNDGVLPLADRAKTIAVVGPLASSKTAPLGPWHAKGRGEETVSVLEGIEEQAGASRRVLHARGCDVEGESTDRFQDAIQAAEQADVVIAVVGEDETMSGEASSRSSIRLPGAQERLLEALHATGKPVIAVVMGGRPMAIGWCAENLPAIALAWSLGSTAGTAIAEVLFGRANPGGKLPCTFPRNEGQIPIHYDQQRTGKPASAPGAHPRFASRHLDVDHRPLYPFGHGLSYTSFSIGAPELSKTRIKKGETLTIRVQITNTGERAGDEVIQAYVRDVEARVVRPERELKAFARVSLEPKESRIVELSFSSRDLAFTDARGRRVVEPGEHELWIGDSSEGGRSVRFEVVR
jgi:beta-glucosidase